MDAQEQAWACGCANGTRDITIRAWVFNARGLGLRPGSCAAVLLSRIWEVTHDGVGVYRQTKSSFSKEFGFDRKTVKSAFDELSRRRLILPAGTYFYRGHDIPMWVVNDRAADKAQADVVGAERVDFLAATSSAEAAAQGAAEAGESRAVWPEGQRDVAPYDEVDASFDEFAARYPRPDATAEARANARRAWRKIMEEGHTPDELGRALDSYLEIHGRRNAGRAPFSPEWMKYLKYLSRWLEDGGSENWRWALAQAGNLEARPVPCPRPDGAADAAATRDKAAAGPWTVGASGEPRRGAEPAKSAEPASSPVVSPAAKDAARAGSTGAAPVAAVDAAAVCVAEPAATPENRADAPASPEGGEGAPDDDAPDGVDRLRRCAESAAGQARLNRVNDGRASYWAAYAMVEGQMKSYELPSCGGCGREEARRYLTDIIEEDLRSLEAWRNR